MKEEPTYGGALLIIRELYHYLGLGSVHTWATMLVMGGRARDQQSSPRLSPTATRTTRPGPSRNSSSRLLFPTFKADARDIQAIKDTGRIRVFQSPFDLTINILFFHSVFQVLLQLWQHPNLYSYIRIYLKKFYGWGRPSNAYLVFVDYSGWFVLES